MIRTNYSFCCEQDHVFERSLDQCIDFLFYGGVDLNRFSMIVMLKFFLGCICCVRMFLFIM
jgi:hypothetical protein